MLRDDALDGDIHASQRGDYLGLAQARSVVFEGDQRFCLVEAKAAEPISVGKFAQTAQLFCG